MQHTFLSAIECPPVFVVLDPPEVMLTKLSGPDQAVADASADRDEELTILTDSLFLPEAGESAAEGLP